MMYGIIFVAILFLIVNLPGYIRKQLTQTIAEESEKARDHFQLSQLNQLSKIEWLRLYPLKKWLLQRYGSFVYSIPLEVFFLL